MKRFSTALIVLTAAAALFAQQVPVPQGADLVDDFGDGSLTLFFDFSGGYDENLIVNGGGGLQYFGANFALTAEAYLRKDDVYSGTSANTASGGMGGLYFWMESGGVAYRTGNFSFRAGRLPHYDYVDSPYSLFINGDGLTADLLEAVYDDGRFLYSTRWIGLNHNSDAVTTVFSDYYGVPATIGIDNTGFPERGANLHTFAARFGDMTFGIQDAIIYVGRNFDFEYFISPIPAYIIQDALRQNGRPWTATGEENNIVGIFWTWDRPDGWKLNAQWLLDDGNLHWLAPSLFPTNQPNKIAWTAGASKETPYGRFSFYHAGATKYTFEPSYGQPGREYGYAYFPDVVFRLKGSAADTAIPFETMMLGYRNGENNLAFLGAWNGDLAGFGLGATVEFTVSGSKSPANSWHEYEYNPDNGTEFLNESPLEWKVVAAVGATRRVWKLDLYAGVALGYVLNELELVASGEVADGTYTIDPYNEIQIWRPSNTDRFLFAATVGGRYRIKIK